jgi:hypothetical protein
MKNDVVLRHGPAERLRRELRVYRRGLAIGIGFALVRVQHLDFVEAHQEHATVAAFLSLAHRRRGLGELNMQLAIAKRLARLDDPAVRHHFHVALRYLPLRRLTIRARPLGKILAGEQDNGV